ncbi:MAG: dipeptide epimerase [candidate division Zixibacteria bacterium]|nr:dipeptide epimerase [candidate division Zixibacteria bacterium]
MNLRYRTFELKLKDPFTISRGSLESKKIIYVEIDEGIGEVSPSSYYGENEGTVKAVLDILKDELLDDPLDIEAILEKVNSKIGGNFSAKAGIDLALHDLIGKKMNLPVHKLLGIKKKEIVTSYTIGLDTIKRMQEKVKEAKGFQVYKVKVGVANDLKMIEAIREVTDAKIRLDANCGWSTKEAIKKLKVLEQFDIELIEQPIPPGNLEDLRMIRENTDIPVFVDEWMMTSKDIPQYKGIADGINIKLMKCGGIREALKMIHVARACNLKIMIGCMIESSVGIAAGAQLAPLVDYLDLDGNLLVSNDPYSGLKLKEGKWILNDFPGLGLKKVK